MSANPQPADLRFARLLRRVRADGPRIVLVALDRLDSLGVLAGLPELLDGEPDVEVVLFGELGTHGAAAPIASHPTRHRRPQRAARRSRRRCWR